jgi:hypothetical protein
MNMTSRILVLAGIIMVVIGVALPVVGFLHLMSHMWDGPEQQYPIEGLAILGLVVFATGVIWCTFVVVFVSDKSRASRETVSCRNCGHENEGGAKYWSKCGNPLAPPQTSSDR